MIIALLQFIFNLMTIWCLQRLHKRVSALESKEFTCPNMYCNGGVIMNGDSMGSYVIKCGWKGHKR